MQYVRLYAGPDGESHFEDLDVGTSRLGGRAILDEPWPVKDLTFLRRGAGVPRMETWHTAPVRQFLIFLDGETEYEASDGQRRRMRPGDVLLVEDTTGKGHRTWIQGERIWIHVPVIE
jgi:hypothetical protein